jgi:sphingolipid 4-desaturase/C4-monooxygenase
MATNDFHFSNSPEPHRIRTKEILSAHPEVKQLFGKNPLTLLAIFGLVGGMIGGSWCWWLTSSVLFSTTPCS